MKHLSLSAAVIVSLAAGAVFAEDASPHASAAAASPERLWVYVGTYTTGESKGIYLFELNTSNGELKPLGIAGEAVNPSFLSIHPSKRFLYAVGEIDDFAGKKSGAVSAFAVDAAGEKLKLLNQQPSGGRGPCYVSMDKQGKHVFVANYSSGSAAALPIRPDGSLAEPSSVVQHEGAGTDPKRQAGPHAHSINLDPTGRFAFVADLGLDKVFIYRFEAAESKLLANDPASVPFAPKSGPRHLAFHPRGRFAYVNSEMSSSVTAFAYDGRSGMLREIQTIGTLPGGFKEFNATSEVQVHPSGKFLYCANRGHDSMAVFTIDEQSGKLTPAGHEAIGGKWPRHFGIDPSGTWLIVANQKSDGLAVFRISPNTGKLETVGTTIHIAAPACVRFAVPGK